MHDENYGNLDIALFVGCQTAKDGVGGNNLPTRIVELGAEVAVGFTEDIMCSDANQWTTAFWESMLNGTTVNAAVNYACSKSDIPITQTVICGNSNYRLMPT